MWPNYIAGLGYRHTLGSPITTLMATLYYAEHVHIVQTQWDPYFCTGQESEFESVPVSKSGNVFKSLRTPLLAWQFLQYEINIFWIFCAHLQSQGGPEEKRRIRSGRRCWTVDSSRSKSVLTPCTGSQGPRTGNYRVWRSHRYVCTGAQNGKLLCLEISQVCVQGRRMGNYRVWRSHRCVHRGPEWKTTVSGDLTGMCVQEPRMENYCVWSHRYVYRGPERETTVSGDLTGMCVQGPRMENYRVWRSHSYVCTGAQNGKLPCLEISQVCVQGPRTGNYRAWRSHRYVCTGSQNGKLLCLEISQICVRGPEQETTVSGDLTGMCTAAQNGKLLCLKISQVCVYRGPERETTVSDLTGMCIGAQNGKLPCLEISQVCVQGPRMGNYRVWRSHRYVYRGPEQETTVSGDLTGTTEIPTDVIMYRE